MSKVSSVLAAAVAVLVLGGCDGDSTIPAGAAAAAGFEIDCVPGTFNGAGSSAQKPAIVAWTDAYQAQCAETAFNYDAQGSNNGRMQFIRKQVPLAGSDAALTGAQKTQAAQRCAPGAAVDLPMVITPIAIPYNLSGVDSLTLTPSALARIFDGRITRWNDPAIAAANPTVSLPDKSITPVHRAADSGTSENLTKFLVAQAPADWPYKPSQAWPNSVGLGAAISTTMVQQIKGTDGAIGYVDNPDAASNGLRVAALDVGGGPVTISPEAVAKVVEATRVNEDGLDITLELAYGIKEPAAYPAIMATYEITCSQGLPEDEARFVKSFLTFTASDGGQQILASAGYIPLPPRLRERVQSAVAQLGAAP